MSFMIEFPPTGPLPGNITSPPYVVFGVQGKDITASLPPLIPLKVVLHFAPALRKWVLPAPDPTNLPRLDAEQAVRTPHVGIDIQAPIDAEGLRWIVSSMLHRSGCKTPKEAFGVHPDFVTSLAIHKTWLILELPSAGLFGVHTHIQAQLMIRSSPVYLRDMRMLWDTFPHNSGIIWAMGLSFMEGLVGLEYRLHESYAILMWLQSTPELCAFFEALQAAVPGYASSAPEPPSTADEKEKSSVSGRQTVLKKTDKSTKSAATQDPAARVIMERDATKKVSLQEQKLRQFTDLQAMQSRLRRTMSTDSLRSVDTAIWGLQETGDVTAGDEADGESVNDDMHDPGNYSGGSFSAELARSLELIRLRREARHMKNTASHDPLVNRPTATDLQQHDNTDKPTSRERDTLNRRLSSTTTVTVEDRLLMADLKARLQVLEDQQKQFEQRKEEQDIGKDESESNKEADGTKLEVVQ